MSIKHLLVTGPPRCGKTTLIQRLAREVGAHCIGFITTEVIEDKQRAGFLIRTFSGREQILAHRSLRSLYRVGKYFIDVDLFDNMLSNEFNDLRGRFVIIDEIGKMELFSQKFRNLERELWISDSPVIATVLFRPHPFCDGLKSDPRALVLTVTRNNQNTIYEQIRNIGSEMAVYLVR